ERCSRLVSTSPTPHLQPAVLEAIREQARSSPDATTGGVLIGRVRGEAITVEGVARCSHVNERNGELEFTQACWDAAYEATERAGPESRILGWYHSDPTHGASLSEYDRMLHRTLFPDPTQVALVLDPRTGDTAWFGWQVEVIGELAEGPSPEMSNDAA